MREYLLGLITVPVIVVVVYLGAGAWDWITQHLITMVRWNPKRVWRRWEWSEQGKYVAFTFKHWPARGAAFLVRPWRPHGFWRRP